MRAVCPFAFSRARQRVARSRRPTFVSLSLSVCVCVCVCVSMRVLSISSPGGQLSCLYIARRRALLAACFNDQRPSTHTPRARPAGRVYVVFQDATTRRAPHRATVSPCYEDVLQAGRSKAPTSNRSTSSKLANRFRRKLTFRTIQPRRLSRAIFAKVCGVSLCSFYSSSFYSTCYKNCVVGRRKPWQILPGTVCVAGLF